MTDGAQIDAKTVILLVVGAIVLLPLLLGGGMMGGFGMMGGVMFLWPVLIIGIIVLLVSGLGEQSQTRNGDQAMAVLRERYARGEISEEEFEERKRGLSVDD